MDKNITIRDLLETEGFEEFKVLAGASGLDTGVTSITIMDSPNPFPWSKGGEVVLSSGYVFKQHIDDFEELIIKMKGAGLVALFIKVKRYFDYLPDTILELADKIGFVIVEVPIEMAFIDVINPGLARIINFQAEAIQISESIHKDFTDLVINGDDTSSIIGVISDLLEADVAYYDQYFNKLYYKDGLEECDDKESLDRVKALMDTYEVYPIGANKKIYGYIIFLDKHKGREVGDYYNTLSHANTALVLDAQMKISSMQIEDRHKNEFIQDIILNNIKSKAEVENRAKLFGWMFKDSVRAMVVDIDDFKDEYIKINDGDELDDTKRKLELTRDHIFSDTISIVKSYFIRTVYAVLSDSIVFLLQADGSDSDWFENNLRQCSKEIRKRIRDRYNFTLTIGIGDSKTDIVDVHESYKEGQMSIKVARVVYKKNSSMFYGELGVYRVLYSVYQDDEVRNFCMSKIGKIIEYDKKNASNLLDTLIQISQNDWNLKDTADRMYLHYNTIKYRFKKISSIVGGDLNNADFRLNISLALKVYQMNN